MEGWIIEKLDPMNKKEIDRKLENRNTLSKRETSEIAEAIVANPETRKIAIDGALHLKWYDVASTLIITNSNSDG